MVGLLSEYFAENPLTSGFISSLDPATYDSDVTCYNCGAHFYLQKQQEKCPYCGSIYRFGGHRHLLNFVAFERNDYELKYAIFLIVLPILLPVMQFIIIREI